MGRHTVQTVQTVQTECYFLVQHYSFLLPFIMCTVHHHRMCTDVYLQGSWIGDEKITGSCLPQVLRFTYFS